MLKALKTIPLSVHNRCVTITPPSRMHKYLEYSCGTSTFSTSTLRIASKRSASFNFVYNRQCKGENGLKLMLTHRNGNLQKH